LKKEIVHLRPFQLDDAQAVFEAVEESLDELSSWLPALKADLSLIQSYLQAQPQARAEGEAYNFAIVDAGDDSFLGGCGLTQINQRHRFANLYYWVRTSRLRQGIATAATLQLAAFGFESLALQRIEIVVAVDNEASLRVAGKAGATREGRLRNRLLANNMIHDAWLFSLIPSDLANK